MYDLELFHCPRNRLQEADLALASSLRGMLEKEVAAKRLELKEDYFGLLEPALQKVLCGVGLQRMIWPAELGGEGHELGLAPYTAAAALEQLGRADVGLAVMASSCIALQALLAVREGCKGLRERLSPLFLDATRPLLVSFVYPIFGEEDGVGWGGRRLQVEAERMGEGWRLWGSGVRPLPGGLDAVLFGALCSVKGEEEPAFILFPGDAPGLKRDPELKKTGLSACRNTELGLEGVEVPDDACLWRGEGELDRLMAWYRLGLAAAASGALLAAYEIIGEWGDNRVIKGKGRIFKDNPLTAAVMGEIAQETAVVRLLAYDLAELLAEAEARGEASSERVAAYSLLVAHQAYAAGERTLHRVMELMASAGYAKEWQLERYWRDLKTVQCHLGCVELARLELARWFFGSEGI
jgi:alkylation response protein AidB-like acyl-CoA dehydrogenase